MVDPACFLYSWSAFFPFLQVDNLTNASHNELMCTHWLWSRAAAERVLIFQTDSLVCRPGADEIASRSPPEITRDHSRSPEA